MADEVASLRRALAAAEARAAADVAEKASMSSQLAEAQDKYAQLKRQLITSTLRGNLSIEALCIVVRQLGPLTVPNGNLHPVSKP